MTNPDRDAGSAGDDGPAEVERLVRELRHELANPVNSVKAALTVLRQQIWTLPPERVEDYLDRMLAEMDRMERTIRALLPSSQPPPR